MSLVNEQQPTTNVPTSTCEGDKSDVKGDAKPCDEKKSTQKNSVFSFTKKKFLYFLLATGTLVSSYLVWRKRFSRTQ